MGFTHSLDTDSSQSVNPSPDRDDGAAHHFTAGGLNEQAVDYWYKAGQRASERSAYAEAISHLTKGLDGLVALPDSPERAQHELHVQIALGPLLIASKGNAAPEAASAYVRARELCQQIGETPQLFSALSGIWLFHQSRMEVQTARELAEQYLALALRHHDSAQLHVAHRMLGQTLSTCGELVSGRIHIERAMAFHDALPHHSHPLFRGQADKVSSYIQMAWTLWFLGYPDQAVMQNQSAIARARELTHSYTLAGALRYMAIIYQLRRQAQATQEHAEAVIALSRAHGFAHQLAWGTMLWNWALVAQGECKADVSEMHQCLEAYHATGAGTLLPQWCAVLAETYGNAEQPMQGLAVLDESLTTGQSTGVLCYQAELYRLKGELLLQQSPGNHTEAETCYQKALSVARSQHAKSWELRAATSLSRLWQQQGKHQEAVDLLAPVYNWFTEGFDTADLKNAKALLAELQG
jgi:predicted ATPase